MNSDKWFFLTLMTAIISLASLVVSCWVIDAQTVVNVLQSGHTPEFKNGKFVGILPK